jgi:AraC-like DNA-binding protein
LRAVRMSGAFFFDTVNYAPWVCGEPIASDIGRRIMPDAEFIVPFHIIISGSCWMDLLGDQPANLRLDAGDVAVFPMGDPHFLMSDPGMRMTIDPAHFDPPPGRKQALRYIVNGERGGEVDCRFICGFMGCDVRPFNPLLTSLPRMFRARSSAVNRAWLSNLALAGVAESERDEAGAGTMLAKLADLMFVEAIRQYVEDPAQGAEGWIAGLRDRHVGAALQLMHERPAEPWTLESLAQKIGSSRSVFAERFASLVGMPAIQYLARWRLTLAARLLDDTGMSIAEAGAQVGYESEAAFHRAFKKYVGTAPGAWRRARSAAAQSPQQLVSA